MSIVLDGTAGITTPNVSTDTSTLGPLTQALNLGSTGQLVFPATQNASANANTLDDYEEGTWTPGVSGRTFSDVFGMYRKIGSCVYIQGECNGCNASITDPTLTGLPFTITNSASVQHGGFLSIPEPFLWTLSAGSTYLYCRLVKNTTTGQFLQGDGETHATGSSIGTSANFRFSGFYFTD